MNIDGDAGFRGVPNPKMICYVSLDDGDHAVQAVAATTASPGQNAMRATDPRLRRAANALFEALLPPRVQRVSPSLTSLDQARSEQRGGSTLGMLTRRELVAGTLSIRPHIPTLTRPMHDSDAILTALADELRRTRGELDQLLAGDGRDTCDIPGFDQLADRHETLVDAVSRMRAAGGPGLVAKARCIDPRPAATRTEGALAISMSIVADIVAMSEG